MSEQYPMQTGLMRITDTEFHALVNFVKKNYGVDLSKKRGLIEGRMTNMLRTRGFQSFQQYIDILLKDTSGKECSAMLNKLTTNYSYFMREPEHYKFLTDIALPYLVKRRQSTRDLRIWSAGCSAGQEAYTTAMLLDEYFGSQKSMWDTRILATDISMNMLAQAQKAIYPADNLKDIPPAWKQKYFVKVSGDSYQVCDKIRSQVIFRPMNLMDPFQHKKPMDIIFCRNVMIYFDTPTKDRLVQKFYHATAEGGFFFIGHSEGIDKMTSGYRYLKPAIYQRGGADLCTGSQK